MQRYRNEDNVCLMFQRFFHMCETKEQQALVLDMEQAFLKIPLADVVHKSEYERLTEKYNTLLLSKKMAIRRLDESLYRAREAAAEKIIDMAIDFAVCKDNGDGTERLFVSTENLRKIAERMKDGEQND